MLCNRQVLYLRLLCSSTPIPRDSAEAAAAYPPVPLPSISNNAASSSTRSVNHPSLPPRLAVNGVSAAVPKSYLPRKNSSEFNEVLATGSTIRMREREEEKGSYSLTAPDRQGSSPVIPLSPDPFGRFASKPAAPLRTFPSYANPGPPESEGGTSSSRFSAESMNGADAKGDKGSTVLGSVKGVKKLWRKSKKLSISGPQLISAPLSNRPPLPGSSQEQLDMPPTPRSPLPPPVPPIPPVKHSRVDSAYDHFRFDQESPYPVHKSKSSQPSISERPPSQSYPATPTKDRNSIRKSILKGWKPPAGESQPQGGMLEPRSSTEHRPSGERPHPNFNESFGGKQRRPSVIDATASIKTSASSNPDIPPNRQGSHVQYVQNGRVAGLSDRRKSRPAITPASSSSGTLHYSPIPVPSSLPTSTSPPRSMMSGTLPRASEDRRPSFDALQSEMIPSSVNNSLSYPYHDLDHTGQ